MLELAILTCIEAQKVISNVNDNPILSTQVKEELIQVLLEWSDCTNGNV